MRRVLGIALVLLSAIASVGDSSTIISIQNQGTGIYTARKYLVLNCTTNMTCALSGGVVTIASAATLTNTGGALTLNAVVLGAGSNDTKVSTGITTNGVAELDLGVNGGTGGVLGLNGSTSGKYTFTPSAAGTQVAGSGNINLTAAAFNSTASAGTAFNSFVAFSGNGASYAIGQISELITLSTSGTTTDSAANLLPANSVIEGVVAIVTTTITTATNWSLGDATIAARFAAANSTLTAGTTQVGTAMVDQTGTSGPRQVAAAKLRITTTGTPGAGAIRVTVYYRTLVAPTS